MGDDYASVGKASLWCAILGGVLPVRLAILVPANALLCGVLFVILELIALGCGIVARRTATGKAGLVISGILVLCFLFVALFFAPVPHPEIRIQAVPEVVPHGEAPKLQSRPLARKCRILALRRPLSGRPVLCAP
jgi:hypothetical protein